MSPFGEMGRLYFKFLKVKIPSREEILLYLFILLQWKSNLLYKILNFLREFSSKSQPDGCRDGSSECHRADLTGFHSQCTQQRGQWHQRASYSQVGRRHVYDPANLSEWCPVAFSKEQWNRNTWIAYNILMRKQNDLGKYTNYAN